MAYTPFRTVDFGAIIPAGFSSNVMESSVGVGGKFAFFTGNWFAARSTDGGSTWTYVNPYDGFADFCCDQVAIYDASRDIFLWLRMGNPDTNPNTRNYENEFKLGVSTNGGESFCTYTTRPTDTNAAWTNQWWDYPHIQLGADNVYISWNIFDWNDTPETTDDDFWVRTVMLRWPLESLRACAGFDYNFWPETGWFTFVPVQGAYHIMYWASNWPTTSPQNSRLRIWTWAEDSTTVSWVNRTVTAWTSTDRGDALCGSSSGNWTARLDQRLLTGARYSIHGTDEKIPGRKILGWWWNVAQGGTFPFPYIEAAAFYEDTLTQVERGSLGRPLVWSSTTCFAYPSATPNKRQDVGMIFHYSTGSTLNPSVAFTIGDDFTTAPPGWTYFNVRTSNARPTDNRWGDYNTVREFEPTQKVWVAASHYLPRSGDCCDASEPVYFVFGRERDRQSWNRWEDE